MERSIYYNIIIIHIQRFNWTSLWSSKHSVPKAPHYLPTIPYRDYGLTPIMQKCGYYKEYVI